jgi:hypothetical protein
MVLISFKKYKHVAFNFVEAQNKGFKACGLRSSGRRTGRSKHAHLGLSG